MQAVSKARQTLTALAASQESLLMLIEDQADSGGRLWQPNPNAWSIAQVIHHVGLSGQALLQTERPKKKRVGKAKFLVMRMVLKSPVRISIPRGLPIVPAPQVAWHEAVNTARLALQAWSAYLDKKEQDDAVFMHPRVGPLTIGQSVIFLQDHFDHHVMQVERLLSKLP